MEIQINDIFYLVLGGLIGYRIAKLEMNLEFIKKEVDEVDRLMKKRNEKGFMNVRILRDVIVAIVVIATSFAAIKAGSASEKSDKAVAEVHQVLARIERVTQCNQQILGAVLISLNERTTYTRELADANGELQKSQKDFFAVLLHKPPFSEAVRSKAVADYYHDLTHFVEINNKTKKKVVENPFPSLAEFRTCLTTKTEGEQ